MSSTRFLFFTFLILINPSVLKAQYDITYESLLDEMVNLKRLTYLSEYEYRAVQFSSYDRRSTSPNEAGWYANSDGFGNEPIPGFTEVLKEPDESGIGEYLICDVKKPGVILRLWTARIKGNVRVYIDDISSPVFEGKAADFFRNAHKVLTGQELLDDVFLQYHALYLPISFANRLRIEWIGDLKKPHFYHVGLRLYDKNVEVEPFSKKTLDNYAEKLQQVTTALTNDNLKPDKQTKLEENVIEAGAKKLVWESEGRGAIDKLQIKVDVVNAENLLRKCLLSIYFDDSSIPQVHSPLGDFFGAAPGINPYNSLPFSVNEEGLMESRFLMPFQKNVKVEIENLAEFDARISVAVETADYKWDEGKSMHFRCRWKMDHDVMDLQQKVGQFSKDYAV